LVVIYIGTVDGPAAASSSSSATCEWWGQGRIRVPGLKASSDAQIQRRVPGALGRGIIEAITSSNEVIAIVSESCVENIY
jgi:hypothetical protein